MKNKFLLSAIAFLLFGAILSAQPITSLSVNGEFGFSFENGTLTILNSSITVAYSDETPSESHVFGNVTSLAFSTPIVTWTGDGTDWATASNWEENRKPDAGDYVIIPAGLSNYPILSAPETVGLLFIASGASIDLNGYSITAKIITDFTVAANTWYPIGFPYALDALYGYGYAADGYNPEMIPYRDTPYEAGYYGDYIAKSYDGDVFSFTQTSAPAGTGSIYQFQPSYYGSSANANKISFLSAGTSVTVGENDLNPTNAYSLSANPTLKNYEVAQGANNNYYYQYNSAENRFERPAISESITFAPFEAFIAINTSNPATLRSSLSVETVTALTPVSSDDAAVSTEYYNLQGVKVAQPQRGGVYLVKSVFQSGKGVVRKSIIR